MKLAKDSPAAPKVRPVSQLGEGGRGTPYLTPYLVTGLLEGQSLGGAPPAPPLRQLGR